MSSGPETFDADRMRNAFAAGTHGNNEMLLADVADVLEQTAFSGVNIDRVDVNALLAQSYMGAIGELEAGRGPVSVLVEDHEDEARAVMEAAFAEQRGGAGVVTQIAAGIASSTEQAVASAFVMLVLETLESGQSPYAVDSPGASGGASSPATRSKGLAVPALRVVVCAIALAGAALATAGGVPVVPLLAARPDGDAARARKLGRAGLQALRDGFATIGGHIAIARKKFPRGWFAKMARKANDKMTSIWHDAKAEISKGPQARANRGATPEVVVKDADVPGAEREIGRAVDVAAHAVADADNLYADDLNADDLNADTNSELGAGESLRLDPQLDSRLDPTLVARLDSQMDSQMDSGEDSGEDSSDDVYSSSSEDEDPLREDPSQDFTAVPDNGWEEVPSGNRFDGVSSVGSDGICIPSGVEVIGAGGDGLVVLDPSDRGTVVKLFKHSHDAQKMCTAAQTEFQNHSKIYAAYERIRSILAEQGIPLIVPAPRSYDAMDPASDWHGCTGYSCSYSMEYMPSPREDGVQQQIILNYTAIEQNQGKIWCQAEGVSSLPATDRLTLEDKARCRPRFEALVVTDEEGVAGLKAETLAKCVGAGHQILYSCGFYPYDVEFATTASGGVAMYDFGKVTQKAEQLDLDVDLHTPPEVDLELDMDLFELDSPSRPKTPFPTLDFATKLHDTYLAAKKSVESWINMAQDKQEAAPRARTPRASSDRPITRSFDDLKTLYFRLRGDGKFEPPRGWLRGNVIDRDHLRSWEKWMAENHPHVLAEETSVAGGSAGVFATTWSVAAMSAAVTLGVALLS